MFLVKIKILSPGGYLPLPLALYLYKTVIFKCLLLWNRLGNFHQISHGAFCWNDIYNLFEWFLAIE